MRKDPFIHVQGQVNEDKKETRQQNEEKSNQKQRDEDIRRKIGEQKKIKDSK